MMVSPFRYCTADDERKHEGEHGKSLNDRRRRHREPEDRRLALARVDGGSATLALQNADEEQRESNQHSYTEQPRRSCWQHGSIKCKHDYDAIYDNRGR